MKAEILRFQFKILIVLLGAAGLCTVAAAGTVTGTVHNGTSDKPGDGIDVTLMQLQGGMQPVTSTTTDSQGRFRFTDPMVGTQPMLIQADYRGVSYYGAVPPGTADVEIQVFEPTNKSSAIAITVHAIILQPNGSEVLVGEEYTVENKTQPPLAYYRDDGSFVFSIPDGAQIKDVSAVWATGMPTVQSPIDKGKNLKAIAYAIRPGESGIRVSYKLPYEGNERKLRFSSPYAAERMAIFAPPSVQVSADGFSPAGQEQGFSVYMRDSVAANTALDVSISGTAPLSSASQGGSTLSTGPGGDESQNPSVNSRADSASETPVATATTMPARLDSLKWIVLGGFGAIFALGFAYLWLRPQAVAARASISEAVPTPGIAEVKREVTGSLDELKDSLFRLELRRQAGTIGEDDYKREHQRIEALLRSLVRG
jgi:hypothetical protein